MNKSYLIYLIGTSGSGKTTIGHALENELLQRGVKTFQFIDGDVIRRQFGGIFGYTYEERMKCNQAVRVVIQYLLDNHISVILAQVAPYKELRRKMREQFGEQYIEIYIKCSYEECARRDVKGYYEKQKKGEMQCLNGADDIFEIPKNSHMIIDTEIENISESVNRIIEYLRELGYGV